MFNKNGRDVQTRTLRNFNSTSQTKEGIISYSSNFCLDIKDTKFEVYFNLRGLQHKKYFLILFLNLKGSSSSISYS